LEQWPVEQSGPLAVISKVHSGLDTRHREGPKIAADRQLHMIQFPPADHESDLLDRGRFRTPGGGYPIAVGGGGRAIVEEADCRSQIGRNEVVHVHKGKGWGHRIALDGFGVTQGCVAS
jgi:hypothetical protein